MEHSAHGEMAVSRRGARFRGDPRSGKPIPPDRDAMARTVEAVRASWHSLNDPFIKWTSP